MKLLIEESVLRQALEAMEEGKYNTRTAQAYDEALTAGRTALDAAETVESLRVDAERYRWIRNQDWEIKRRVPLRIQFDKHLRALDEACNADVIDAAIDAAMKEST